MKLYYFHVAPNPTRVLLYLGEKKDGGCKIPLDLQLVDVRKGEQNSPEHLARNPFGRLPVLELDDGTHLTESLAIISYLEELHPEPAMIGSTPEERARVREVERIAELGVLYPTARLIHAIDSPYGWPPNPAIAEFYRPRLDQALRVLEERLADGRLFLAGDRVSLADCTLAAAFQFGRFGKIPLCPSLEQLERWDGAFRARPAARAVLKL